MFIGFCKIGEYLKKREWMAFVVVDLRRLSSSFIKYFDIHIFMLQ